MARECITEDTRQDLAQGGKLSLEGDNHQSSACQRGRAALFTQFGGAAFVIAILCGFFYRTVFLGKPIAKLDLLRSLDALHNPTLTQPIIPIPCDPSGVLIFFPLGHFAHECWSRGVVPLWNPYIGCGYPMVGDPQSFIFSIAHVAGLFSTPQTYNAGLVLEIFLGALGVYFFSRFLRLSLVASAFAALAYSLSARNLGQIDLSGAECFYPWLFLFFGWMARKPGLGRIVACGLLSSATAYCSHPEPAFFAVMYAAIFAVCSMTAPALVATGERSAAEPGPASAQLISVRCRNALAVLSSVALIAVCFTAPLIFSFCEFMKHAFFYKEAASSASFISFSQFVSSFYAAQGAESYFPGAVALLLLPFGFMRSGRPPISVLITAVICAALTIPPGFLLPLLSMKPLSYIATLYGVPELLMLMAIIAAAGMDNILGGRLKLKGWCLLILSAVAVGIGPYVISYFATASDTPELIQKAFADSRPLIQAVTWTAAGGFLVLFARQFLSKMPMAVFAVALLALNLTSIGLVSRHALPSRLTYSLACPAVLEQAAKAGERVVGTGSNFFLANTNSNYHVSDLRSFNPLVPARYKRFVTECGATSHNLYFLNLPDTPLSALDFAAVKWLVTRTASCAEEDLHAKGRLALNEGNLANHQQSQLPARRLAKGVRLCSFDLSFDGINSQIDGHLSLQVQGQVVNRYALQFVVIDAVSGKELRMCPQHLISGDPYAISNVVESVHVPVPLSIAGTMRKLALGVRVIDSWTGLSMTDGSRSFAMQDKTLILCSFDRTALTLALGGRPSAQDQMFFSRHYRLVSESAEGIRVYENTRAVPRAYLVDAENAILTSNENESLQFVKSGRDPWRAACIEIPSNASSSFSSVPNGQPSPNLTRSSKQGDSGGGRMPAELGKPGSVVSIKANSMDNCAAHDSSTVRHNDALGNEQAILQGSPTVAAIKSPTGDRAAGWRVVEMDGAGKRSTGAGFQVAHIPAASRGTLAEAGGGGLPDSIRQLSMERPDSNTVIVWADCGRRSYLVLTDLFYPGWRCTVDDKEVPVYAANYLFRGVELERGTHTVRFVFAPLTFVLGVCASIICLLGISLLALLQVKKLAKKNRA